MKAIFIRARSFLFFYLLSLVSCFGLLLFFSNESLTLAINLTWDYAANRIAPLITLLGDGNISWILALVLLFFGAGKALSALLIVNFAGLAAQILKKNLFAYAVRPVLFFPKGLHLVKGVTIYAYQSFPSGHTATAFSAALLLALYLPNRWAQLSLLMTASLVGWSRIYLAEHFFLDVVAGSVTGVVIASVLFFFTSKLKVFNLQFTPLALIRRSHA